jgi:uncharacterized membrane protein
MSNKHTFIIALLGAVKLIFFAFGITFISDKQIDAIVNGISSLCVLSGIIMSYFHSKNSEKP